MAKIVKPVLFSLTILLATVVLSVPVSRFILERSAFHYLGHRLDIRTYHFNLDTLYLDGTFDDNSTIRIKAVRLMSPARRIDVTLDSRSTFFESVANSRLPAFDFNATASYSNGNVHADVRLFGGTLHTEFMPATSRYTYTLEGLRLERLLHTVELPPYASGSLFGSGEGVTVPPYSHRAVLKLYNIKPNTALIDMAGSSFPNAIHESNATMRLTFEDGHLLRDKLHVASPQFLLDLDDSKYDLSNGAFSFSARFANKHVAKIPVRSVEADGSGYFLDKRLSGDLAVDTDAYRVRFEHLVYTAEDTPSLSTGFRIMTHSTSPYDLTGPNALHGTLAYRNGHLDADVTGRAMAEPLKFRYADGNGTIISNNIPLETLTAIFNRPDTLHGYLDLNGTIDTHTKYPAVLLTAAAKKVMPDGETAAKLQLTRPGRIALLLKGKDGQYRADLSTESQLVENGTVRIDYDAMKKRAKANGTLRKLTLPWFHSADIMLQTDVDLSEPTLYNTKIASPFETLSVPEYHLSKKSDFTLHYRVGALERFIPDANRTAELEGSAVVSDTEIHLAVNDVGSADFSFGTPVKRLSVTKMRLQNVFGILGRPAPLRGDLDLTASFDDRAASVALHSAQLVPSRELNASLRAFPLDAAATFTHRDWHSFRGRASLKTVHDTLSLPAVDLDLAGRRFKSTFRLDFDDVNRSAVLIPGGLIGDRLSLEGNVYADKKRQALSARTEHLVFDRRVRRLIDKNATGSLPVLVDLNASHDDESVELNASAFSDHFVLAPVHAGFRQATSLFFLEALLDTDIGIGKTFARLEGKIDGKALSGGTLYVTTRAQALEATNLLVDPGNKDYEADVKLSLSPINEPQGPKKAVVYGSIRTRPEMQASLRTESFEGNLSAVMNDDLLIVHASELSVPQLLHFVSTAPAVTRGSIGGNVILDAGALLEGNLSRLSGGIDVRARDLRIEGIDIDGYLETLRQTQDLSLFQGSLSELPIVRTVKNLPEDLFAAKPIRTDVTQARFGAAVTNGVLVCEDCAAATPKHRVAFAGNIDLPMRRFDHFYAALLNPKGCPYFMQRINGTLSDPRINLAESGVRVIGGVVVSLASNVTDAANWLTGVIYRVTSATGEVIRYVPLAGRSADKALTTVAGTLHGATATECTPFYIGVIPPPPLQ